MTGFPLPETIMAVGGLAGRVLPSFVAGVLLGFAHFGSLWWNARLYARGGSAGALALQILRFALLLIVFGVLARIGAAALLAGTIGLLLARAVTLRQAARMS